jgi:hypothetical protein
VPPAGPARHRVVMSTSAESPTTRRRLRFVLVAVSGLIVLGGVLVGWPAWTARQEWRRLDNAADDFGVPAGFTEVARLRQGSGFCIVTCTNGGEAVVTIVFETDYSDPTEACRALRPAVVDLTGDAEDASYLDRCGWRGELGGPATVFAGAGRASGFSPHDGNRWTDAATVPDSPVVAFVEFNSGIE